MKEIRVYGIPKPGGSKKAFINRFTGRANVVEDCKKNKDWRESVKAAWIEKYNISPMIAGPISLLVTFIMPRPKAHYNSRWVIKEWALSEEATKKPDLTKLLRSTEDALTKIAWHDDAQIIRQSINKRYEDGVDKPGAIISVIEIEWDEEE